MRFAISLPFWTAGVSSNIPPPRSRLHRPRTSKLPLTDQHAFEHERQILLFQSSRPLPISSMCLFELNWWKYRMNSSHFIRPYPIYCNRLESWQQNIRIPVVSSGGGGCWLCRSITITEAAYLLGTLLMVLAVSGPPTNIGFQFIRSYCFWWILR